MTQPCDILFYVQHLLGIGHLRRAAVIARALDRAGLRVVFVSGGMPVPGLDIGGAKLTQLPPLRSRDETFDVLLDESGQIIDDSWKAARAERLLSLYREERPRIVLIEMFPFGRRQMRFELLPLLEAAMDDRPKPRIICSLRDILTTHKKPGKTAWILDIVQRYFDSVLVHGDPAFITLTRSFPQAEAIADKIHYTGYVVNETLAKPVSANTRPADSSVDDRDVIVSTGGGAVAEPLIKAVLSARALTPLAAKRWRVLVGHNLPEPNLCKLQKMAPEGIIIERSRPDFLELLNRSCLSISQAGYNTVLEVLGSGIPAVVVPFAAGSETEQALRAQLLAERGAIVVVEEANLTPESLAAGVAAALQSKAEESKASGQAATMTLDTDGGEKTAELLRRELAVA